MLRLIDTLDVPPPQVQVDVCIITEEDGKTTSLRAPGIRVLDGEEASVFVGSVHAWAQAGGQEREVRVGVRLRVTPRVCPGTDSVLLEIAPEVTDAPVFRVLSTPNGGVRVPESLLVKKAHTKMLLRSAETGTVAGFSGEEADRCAGTRNTVFLVTPTIIPRERPPDRDAAAGREVEAVREAIAAAGKPDF